MIDQSAGTTIYTVPPAATASFAGLRFGVGNVPGAVTVSNFVDATGVTTSYTIDLLAGDQLSDDSVFALAAGDYIKVESTAPGISFYCYIDLP